MTESSRTRLPEPLTKVGFGVTADGFRLVFPVGLGQSGVKVSRGDYVTSAPSPIIQRLQPRFRRAVGTLFSSATTVRAIEITDREVTVVTRPDASLAARRLCAEIFCDNVEGFTLEPYKAPFSPHTEATLG